MHIGTAAKRGAPRPHRDRISGSGALLVAVAALATIGAQCDDGPVERCVKDADCGDYRFCHSDGTCRCTEDRGCGDGEFCNPAFLCQVIAGCNDNSDCLGETFCDITSGLCIGQDQCTIETHCPFNQVCDPGVGRCVPGCRDEADCSLGYACLGATRTSFGQCAVGVCRGNDFCEIQELCDLSSGTCVYDDRGDFCGACQNLWDGEECGGGANYCLIEPATGTFYCGVDCSQGQACPYGYECHDVIILPPAAPLCNVERCASPQGGTCGESEAGCSCTITSGPCQTEFDCGYGPPGGDCARAHVGNCLIDQTHECSRDDDCCESPPCAEGSCVLQECSTDEGSCTNNDCDIGKAGHCTCTRDLDCPADECRGADLTDPENQIPGSCLISGHSCYDTIDCDVIACVSGGCMIGQNCAPGDDRTCRELSVE